MANLYFLFTFAANLKLLLKRSLLIKKFMYVFINKFLNLLIKKSLGEISITQRLFTALGLLW